jgi:uncharacterized delta-60 repeat protein
MCLVRGSRRLALLGVLFAALVLPLIALAAPAALDKHFGKHGLAIAQVGEDGSGANLVTVTPDGDIVAAGMSVFAEGEDSDGDFVVARFTPKGKLDAGFGDKGGTIVDFGDDYSFDFPSGLALTNDGKILVAGYGSDEKNSGASVTRLDEDGKLDQTLANDGTLTTDGPLSYATSVLPLPQGAFFLVGPQKNSLGIEKFKADGSVDQTFGSGGLTLTDLGEKASIGDAILTDDGKIVVVAHPSQAPSAYLPGVPKGKVALLRFTADGALDTSFGEDGAAVADGSAAYSLAEDSKGNIIVGGGTKVVRFTADGKLDSSFARGGVFTFSPASGFTATALAIGAKDAVAVSGTMRPHKSKATAAPRFAVAVLTSKGKLNRKFGNQGFTADKHGDVAKGVTTQDDGKIVAVGRTIGRNIFTGDIAGRETKMMVARYLKP